MKSKIVNFVAYLPLVIIVSILALVATESSKLQPQVSSTQNNIKDIQRNIVMLDESLLNYEKLLNQHPAFLTFVCDTHSPLSFTFCDHPREESALRWSTWMRNFSDLLFVALVWFPGG